MDLFTLNKCLGFLLGAAISFLKHGDDASFIAFGAAFGYGLSFLITIMVIIIFDGRQKLAEFQYAVLSRERFLFSFKSDKFMYMMAIIYLSIFSGVVKFYNPDLTTSNAIFFGFIATSFFTATSLILHANLMLLTFFFTSLVFLNGIVTQFNLVEFSRESLIVIYFPLSFFFVSGYIEEYKRLEYKILAIFFSDEYFDDLAVSLFKLNKPAYVKLPGSSFAKLTASASLWILLLSTVNFDFSYFHGFLSAIKN